MENDDSLVVLRRSIKANDNEQLMTLIAKIFKEREDYLTKIQGLEADAQRYLILHQQIVVQNQRLTTLNMENDNKILDLLQQHQKFHELQTRNDILENTIREREMEIEALKANIDTLKQGNDTRAKLNCTLTVQLDNFKQKLQNLSKEYQKVCEDLQEVSRQKKQLEEKLQYQKIDLTSAQEQLDRLSINFQKFGEEKWNEIELLKEQLQSQKELAGYLSEQLKVEDSNFKEKEQLFGQVYLVAQKEVISLNNYNKQLKKQISSKQNSEQKLQELANNIKSKLRSSKWKDISFLIASFDAEPYQEIKDVLSDLTASAAESKQELAERLAIKDQLLKKQEKKLKTVQEKQKENYLMRRNEGLDKIKIQELQKKLRILEERK